MPVKKPSKKKITKKKSTKKISSKGIKDPEGGLTAKGRAYFKKKEGAELKPGVKGKADTPEKMKRKGSFFRRHYANPAGPLKKENGEPTRLALAAHAWGEKVPKTLAEAKKLAEKGSKLLERYEKSKAKKKAPVKKKTTVKKKKTTKTAAKKTKKKTKASR